MNSGETPDAAGFPGSPAQHSENSETEKALERPQLAAELAARLGAPPRELGDEAELVPHGVGRSAGDAEDVELALWEQAARSSVDAVAFSLDGAL